MSYPPEPWQLRGRLCASVFLVPADALPADAVHANVPVGYRPVRVGGKAVVGAVWVCYEPGGVLSYRELMTTLLVRRGVHVLPTITHIWVDSEASRDGGRALWGIPKELAEFEIDSQHFSARDGAGPLAVGTVRPRFGLPGRWPVRFRIAQVRDGRPLVSPVRSTARLRVTSASFVADPSGPLAFLSGRAPLVSFELDGFRMVFGR